MGLSPEKQRNVRNIMEQRKIHDTEVYAKKGYCVVVIAYNIWMMLRLKCVDLRLIYRLSDYINWLVINSVITVNIKRNKINEKGLVCYFPRRFFVVNFGPFPHAVGLLWAKNFADCINMTAMHRWHIFPIVRIFRSQSLRSFYRNLKFISTIYFVDFNYFRYLRF